MNGTTRSKIGLLATTFALATAGCASDTVGTPGAGGGLAATAHEGNAESAEAQARIDELFVRFQRDVETRVERVVEKRPVLGEAVATGFERTGEGALRAIVPAAARRGVIRAANVSLPATA